MYIPKEGDVMKTILRESHREHYCAHAGVTDMYADMKKHLFWLGMKINIVNFVSNFLECHQVKDDHSHPHVLCSIVYHVIS